MRARTTHVRRRERAAQQPLRLCCWRQPRQRHPQRRAGPRRRRAPQRPREEQRVPRQAGHARTPVHGRPRAHPRLRGARRPAVSALAARIRACTRCGGRATDVRCEGQLHERRRARLALLALRSRAGTRSAAAGRREQPAGGPAARVGRCKRPQRVSACGVRRTARGPPSPATREGHCPTKNGRPPPPPPPMRAALPRAARRCGTTRCGTTRVGGLLRHRRRTARL
jgi:hypothetical protein